MTATGRRQLRTGPGLLVSVTARGREGIARGLGAWLVHAAPRSARGTVDVAVVGDAEIRRLNREFRGVDAATDVLSFPAAEDGPSLAAARNQRPLGDIAIAAGVARRQAAQQGHSMSVELRVLALHGLLHLLGYDHEADDGRMRRLEERLRRRAGLPAGLIQRTPRLDARA